MNIIFKAMGAGSSSSRKGHKSFANRKKSLSDGNLCESLRQYQDSIKRKEVHENIAARDIESPAVAGYLDRRLPNGSWQSCWCVLKDSSLYRYSAPVDEVTEDILLLHGYEVLRCSEVGGKEFNFELLHPNHPSEVLAASTSEELTEWIAKLKQATQHMSIEGLDLEQGSSKQFTDLDAEMDEGKVKHLSKQQLLQEVLQEKMRLEQSQRRKRKERSRLGDVFQNDDPSPMGSASSTPELSPDVVSLTSHSSCTSVRVSGQSQSQTTMEQSLRDISHLRQRKASTQLKVETLQRQLTMSGATKQKPKRFKLGLGSKHHAIKETVKTDNTHIHKQIESLQSELDKISNTLEAKKKIALGDLGSTDIKTHSKKKGPHTPDETPCVRGSVGSGPLANTASSETKRNSDGSVHSANGTAAPRSKVEVSRTNSADAPSSRHSWDTSKEKQPERNSCQPIARERAYTTPDEINARPRHGSSSSQGEIDPAVLAQISAFEELLQERLHIQ